MKLSITLNDSGIKTKPSKATSDTVDTVLPVVEKTFQEFLKKNPHFKSVKEVTITLTLCGKAKIKKLNREYRQKDYATDVLSFPVYENLRPDKKSKEKTLPQVELGDLVVCRDVAKTQAKEFGITYVQEVIHLASHGFLHLLGFDHEISLREEKIMQGYEDELVKKIYKRLK
jgi:probable rRNA maturation factor